MNNEQYLTTENIEFAKNLAHLLGRSILADNNEKSIEMCDLEQESFLGLYEASQRYDKALGIEFRTLAFIWCRKFILRAVRKFGTPLSVPCNYESEDVKLLHFDVSGEEISTLDAADEGTLEDRLLYQMAIAEEAENEAAENRRELVKRALSRLSHQERKALICLFGLNTHKPLNEKKAAGVLGVTPSRVTQIKQHALRKVEKNLPILLSR